MDWKRWLGIAVCLLALGLVSTGVAVAQDQESTEQEMQQAEGDTQEVSGETLDDVVKRKFSGEITVTSTRREVNVRELPASVAVTEGADLESIGATSMDDYVSQIPGVNYIDGPPQFDSVTVRGITTAYYSNLNQQPVGTYINEVPVTDYFANSSTFDLGGFDIERVEFLKGPQGTMYGAASLGGTMRYILNRPNLDRNEGALHLTTQAVTEGGINWLAQGMFNVVLAEGKFALRGVAGYEDNAGWIDNVYTQEENWNNYNQKTLRLIASWKPADPVRLDFTYLQRNADVNGRNDVDGTDLDNPVTGIDGFGYLKAHRTFDQSIANITLNWDLGFAELVSSTSYLVKDNPFYVEQAGNTIVDTKLQLWAVMYYVLGIQIPPEFFLENFDVITNTADPAHTESWFQEVRLVSRDTGRFDWLAGIFYADTRQNYDQIYRGPGGEDLINAVAPPWGSLLFPNDEAVKFIWWDKGRELSVYGELGIDLSEQWKLTLGGRYTDWKRDHYEHLVQFGILVDQEIFSPPFDERIFSPKASLSFRPNADTLWYALASKGYRTGGQNAVYIATGGQNEDFFNFKTDNLINYETGVKKSWSGGKFITDFTLFYLDWTDIQLEADFYDPVLGTINAIFNTSAAHSQGVEANVTARLARGLTFSTNITYTDAELDQPTPELVDTVSGDLVVVPAGTPLPATPGWSTFSTLQYFWDNQKLGYPFIALDHFYKDSILVWLTHGNTVPSYNTFGLRMGTTFSNGINLTLAVRNLTDTRAWTVQTPPQPYTFVPLSTPPRGYMTQPRAVSLTIQKNF